MTTNVKAFGIELTESIKNYALNKMVRIRKLLSDHNNFHAEIELAKTTAHHHKGEVFRAEINMSGVGELYRAEASADDLYAAIDLAKDELVQEIKGRRMRKESLFRKGSRIAKRLLRIS